MEMSSTMKMNEQQMGWYRAVCERLNPERLKKFLFDITNIHSPTGATRDLGEYMAKHLASIGMKAAYKPMSLATGNVMAEMRGSGGGASLLLYSPLDTHLEGDQRDYPAAGPEGYPDLKPQARMLDDWVYGLGSSNPKAMTATIVEIANAIIEADVPLVGDLVLAGADGGMPVNVPYRDNAGMSNGISHLLCRGLAPDFAIIMKPWNWVYHEEPGMGWFKIQVKGSFGYAGVPRGIPGFRSSITPASTVIVELEKWIIDYAERNTSGVVKPHGWISAINGGDSQRPAFPPAVTEICFDVRINPRTTPAEVKTQFARFMADLNERHPELDMEWEMYGTAPGGTTDPNNWIIQSTLRGWEHVEGRPHGTPDYLGGQTDGAALRRFGVPTARVGWPWPAQGSPLEVAEGLGGMGATYIPDLMPCARKIVYAVIDTLTRPRNELGL